MTQGVAILGQSVIQAGVQSTIQGGSFLDALKASGVSNLSAALAVQIGDAKGDLSQIFGQKGGEIVSTIAHGALGCASAAALGNGCAGGAIGGALGSALNSIFDPSQILPPELHIGFMGLAGALVAGALGQDANAAATAAQNETQNNWLKHKADGFNKPSEADQLKAAASVCSASGNLNSESCGKLNDLRATSLARDQALMSACADAGSAACMLAMADAKANGTIVVRASNGQLFVVDPADSQILSGDPNPKATLLETQKVSALGGILPGIIVALGGSTETALEGAQLGQAVEGVGAGVTSWGTTNTGVAKPVATAGAKNTTPLISFNPLNPGPLSPDIANTFRSGTYTQIVAEQPTTLYRVYGGTANQLGGFWTSTPPAGPVQSIVDSALLPQWGNTATNVVKMEIPAGTVYFTGVAAPQGGLVGEGNQVVFPAGFRVDQSWIK